MIKQHKIGLLAAFSLTSLTLLTVPVSAKAEMSSNSQQHPVATLSGNLHSSNRPTPVSTRKILRLGSRGENVKGVQETLKKQGFYRGTVDGVFGRGTRTAVMAFQRKHNLHADGVVGSHTQAVLNQG